MEHQKLWIRLRRINHSHKTMCLLNGVLKLTNLEQSILTWDNAME
jgi:hypothetical protein